MEQINDYIVKDSLDLKHWYDKISIQEKNWLGLNNNPDAVISWVASPTWTKGIQIYKDDKPIGFAIYQCYIPDKTISMQALYVDKEFRMKKAATSMLEYIIEYASINGFKKIESRCYKNNDIGLKFHEKNKFRKEGERINSVISNFKRVNLVIFGKDV